MKALLLRLRLAWCVLRARRFVVFLPAYPTMNLAVGGRIGPAAWEAICAFAITEHLDALAAAEARLLADVHAEAGRIAAIEAEIRAVLGAR